jgi:hypothetical protein
MRRSESVKEGKKLVIRLETIACLAVVRREPGQRGFLQGEMSVQIDLGGVDGFVRWPWWSAACTERFEIRALVPLTQGRPQGDNDVAGGCWRMTYVAGRRQDLVNKAGNQINRRNRHGP